MAFRLSLFCHSRSCPSYPRRRVSHAVGIAVSLFQTGDSRLCGSDGRDESCGIDVVK